MKAILTPPLKIEGEVTITMTEEEAKAFKGWLYSKANMRECPESSKLYTALYNALETGK